MSEINEVYEREVGDLACFEFRTTVVIGLYRIRCPECGIRTERVEQLPTKAQFSKRFEEMVRKRDFARNLTILATRGQIVSTGGRTLLFGRICAPIWRTRSQA